MINLVRLVSIKHTASLVLVHVSFEKMKILMSKVTTAHLAEAFHVEVWLKKKTYLHRAGKLKSAWNENVYNCKILLLWDFIVKNAQWHKFVAIFAIMFDVVLMAQKLHAFFIQQNDAYLMSYYTLLCQFHSDVKTHISFSKIEQNS